MGVIDHLGFVQVDSVNTVARAHDMILWSRRQQYRPAALSHLLHRDRQVFEHWTHDASVIPMAFWPHWRLRFDRDRDRLASRWAEWQSHGFADKIDAVRRQIADTGHCTSAEVGADEVRGSGGWWDWHPSKTALEYLWRCGEVSVVRRDGFKKVYDLTERVIPEAYRAAIYDSEATIDWACNAAINRLAFATSGEVAAFWGLVTPDEAKVWCARELAAGRLIEVGVTGTDGSVRRSFARPDLPDLAVPDALPRVRILSPFDPALRDRKRAARLFGFYYRIEIFVPAPRRRYGYYVFPVIEGDTLIGRIDAKRDGDVLAVAGFWPEVGIRMGAGRLARLQAELDRLARFVGCGVVDYAEGWLRM